MIGSVEAGVKHGELEELYADHAPAAVGLAYLLTADRGFAEDLVQEAFVRLAGRFRHLRDPHAFPAYLRRTVVNLHTSHLRRRRLERAFVEREGARPAQTSSLPDVAVRDEVWSAMSALSPRQRTALVLRFFEDLDERETARVMGCSTGAVNSLVTRGLRILRTEIEE